LKSIYTTEVTWATLLFQLTQLILLDNFNIYIKRGDKSCQIIVTFGYHIIHMENYFIITTHLLSYVCNYPVKLCLPWGRRQLTWIISYYAFCKFSWIKSTQQRLLWQHVVSTKTTAITRHFI